MFETENSKVCIHLLKCSDVLVTSHNNRYTTGNDLGPVLFLIHINDLPLASDVFIMLMYTDDITLYCNIGWNVNEITINNEIFKIQDLLTADSLSLDVDIYNSISARFGNDKQQYKVCC